jgi:hypothetical protein
MLLEVLNRVEVGVDSGTLCPGTAGQTRQTCPADNQEGRDKRDICIYTVSVSRSDVPVGKDS